jgi:hypothetical protein
MKLCCVTAVDVPTTDRDLRSAASDPGQNGI